MSKQTRIISWILQIFAAAILLQTLYFKFTGHPDSVAIFTELGMEPHGRILVGIVELLVALLLLVRQTVIWGAILGVGNMTGAILAHITKLGFSGSNGSLGALAIAVALACAAILYLRRHESPLIANMFAVEKDVEDLQKEKEKTRDVGPV